MSNTKMCRVEHGRLLEMQTEIMEIATRLSGLVAGLMQIAGDIPGGKLLDLPGAKPRAKAIR